MKKKFKFLVLKIIKFILILLVFDFGAGFIVKKIYFGQKTGKQARITHSIKKDSSDIVIFGSSHANRHYVPEVIEKELDKTCYNAGVQGQGIMFNNVLQHIIIERTKPEILILNIDYNWLYERADAYDRLSDLHPYYWEYRDQIRPVINLNSKFSDFKLLFKSYQFNSTLVHAVRYFASPQKDFKGYIPLTGEVKKSKIKVNHDEQKSDKELPFDTNFVSAYKAFIHNAKLNNIKLLIVVSPSLYTKDISRDKSMSTLKKIAQNENVPLIDFYDNSLFNNQYQLFNDLDHLNHEGAQIFSKLVADFVKINRGN